MKYILILILLSSCATTSDRYREGSNQGQQAALTPAQERQMTREYLPKLEKEYPPIKDRVLQNYITRIGNKLVAANNLDGRPYRYNFTVVKAKFPNAFALPAGTIYVTAPLINMASSEAELAGVVGHEIGHVIARHSAERMYLEQKNRTRNTIFTVGGGLAGALGGYFIGKKACKKGDSKCLAKAAAIGGAVGAGGVFLIQKFGFMKNSREDEMEADRIGFNIATRAGYSKDHIGKFYEKLLAMEKSHSKGSRQMKFLTDALSTHPPSNDRIRQMRQMAAGSAQRNGTVNGRNFFAIKKRVIGFL